MPPNSTKDLRNKGEEMTFNTKLINLLKKDRRFVDDDGELVLAAVQDAAWKIDRDLVKLLLTDNEIKAKFFEEIEGHWIFNVSTFIDYISQKNFLDNSYTRFRNRIGLTIGGKYLRERGEVALVWPYKDCVLEGGQTKEEEKRKEIFFNEVLAQDEINRLLDPKVLTNFVRYTAKGKEKLTGFKRDENGVIRENLIIKGNNLIALHTLKTQFHGRVKLIYIDPPYNTGNDEFKYNDAFNHSSWLTFMKNRLEVAKKMLKESGVIFVSCDDNEQAYLKILLDEVFKRENFVSCLIWKSNPRGRAMDKFFATTKEYILVYAKDITKIDILMKVIKDTKKIEKYKYRDDISLYKKGYPLHNGTRDFHINNRPNLAYSIYYNPDTKDAVVRDEKMKDKNGLYYIEENYIDKELDKKGYIRIIPKVNNETKQRRVWRWGTEKFLREYKTELLFVEEDSGYYIYQKDRLSRAGEKHEKYKDIIEGIRTDEGGLEIKELLGEKAFSFPKPSKLLKHLFSVVDTKKDSIIMDFFSGSGTTAQAVLELNREDGGNRQFILCEQLDYVDTVTIPRVKRVIRKIGGGDFIYCELMKYNEAFMDRIQAAQSSEELLHIWREMAQGSFLKWYVNPQVPEEAVRDFEALGKEENGLEKQKHLLAELLDKNQLYVNLSEIDDAQFKVSEEDKALNKSFYGEGL
jgi:adenine-specific DNA-methyltransferase